MQQKVLAAQQRKRNSVCAGVRLDYSCTSFVCSGQVILSSVAPRPTSTYHLGVFAEGQNVSALLEDPFYFLPTCEQNTQDPNLDVTLQKVSSGYEWTSQSIPARTGRLVPRVPQVLRPHLSGEYECVAAGYPPSTRKYRLEVVGE